MSIAHFSGLLPAFGLWALVLAQGAFADEPVAGYVNGTQEVLYKTSLANGNEARRLKFSLTVVTDDPKNPINLGSQDCFATYVFTKEGQPLSGKGFCDGITAGGDLWWIALELQPDGTTRWTNLGGIGKLAKLTGSGTTRTLAQFDDGKTIARFEGTYSMD